MTKVDSVISRLPRTYRYSLANIFYQHSTTMLFQFDINDHVHLASSVKTLKWRSLTRVCYFLTEIINLFTLPVNVHCWTSFSRNILLSYFIFYYTIVDQTTVYNSILSFRLAHNTCTAFCQFQTTDSLFIHCILLYWPSRFTTLYLLSKYHVTYTELKTRISETKVQFLLCFVCA